MSLEEKIQENGKTGFAGALKQMTLWDWAKALATNAAGAALSGGILGYGAINVLTTSASFLSANYLLNRKKGFTKNGLQTDINFSAAYTPALSGFLGLLDRYCQTPLSWMGGYAAGMIPFTAATNAVRSVIEKYSPLRFVKGLFQGEVAKDVERIVKDIPNSAKSGAKAGFYLTAPVGASRYLLPRELLIASLFPLRAAYRYITGRDSGRKQYSSSPSYGMASPYMQAA